MSKKKTPVHAVINQAYEMVATDGLKLHPRNVNKGDLAAIGESIDEKGFYGAIIAQRSTGYILAGNHRYQAATGAGIQDVPVIWVDVDDSRALKILLADNRTTRKGKDDQQALADLLQEVISESGSLHGTGFTDEELDGIIAGLGNDVLSVPEFAPVGAEDQGRLDQKKPIICPNCSHEFTP